MAQIKASNFEILRVYFECLWLIMFPCSNLSWLPYLEKPLSFCTLLFGLVSLIVQCSNCFIDLIGSYRIPFGVTMEEGIAMPLLIYIYIYIVFDSLGFGIGVVQQCKLLTWKVINKFI